MNCSFCQKEIPETKIHMRDDCPGCGRDLHICLNCEFYDANAYRQCRESIREPVPDKERANFCDFFRASAKGAALSNSPNETIKALNDLFK
ncbi:MAG: hypothetical protein R3297_03180 [Desulfobulbales bacterium]|nr:hypothetical protein [Desulfobulbales bacterium]